MKLNEYTQALYKKYNLYEGIDESTKPIKHKKLNEDMLDNREALNKLHYIDFDIGETVTNRSMDCLANKLNIEDFTDNQNLFFTDNWLPILLKDIPGKYVWIGFRHGRGKTLNKYFFEMMDVASQIPNGIIYDFTNTTDMLFVFIPDEVFSRELHESTRPRRRKRMSEDMWGRPEVKIPRGFKEVGKDTPEIDEGAIVYIRPEYCGEGESPRKYFVCELSGGQVLLADTKKQYNNGEGHIYSFGVITHYKNFNESYECKKINEDVLGSSNEATEQFDRLYKAIKNTKSESLQIQYWLKNFIDEFYRSIDVKKLNEILSDFIQANKFIDKAESSAKFGCGKVNESYRMEESRGSSISIRSMERDIEKAKNKLKKKAKQNGVWENFGQDEVRKIDDKYGSLQTENYAEYSRLLNAFSDWCATYTTMNESLFGNYDSYDGWTEEDIELHKNIDWASRNYFDYPVDGDSFESTAVLYTPQGRKTTKTTFIKYIRSNPIFPPYYAPKDTKPFGTKISYLGPMANGHSRNGYDIHDRYETQEVYDEMSR